MVANKFAFGLVAASCIAAAGAGAFLATRLATPSSQPGVALPLSAPDALPRDGGEGVTETEATLEPAEGQPATQSLVPLERPADRPIDRSPVGIERPEKSRMAAKKPAPVSIPARVPARPESGPSASAGGVGAERTPTAPPQEPVPTAPATAESFPSQGAGAAAATEPEPVDAAEPPRKTFEELVVSADSVIGIQIDTHVSSDRARIEDRVDARVTRDVRVGDAVAIPAGSRMIGSVIFVQQGGKFKETARLGIRFHTLVLADGNRVALNTEPIYRDGQAPGGESAAKVGGAAIGGAILGAIFGGSKGAAIGGTVGAAGGTAAVMAGERNAATLPAGSTATVKLQAPATITVEK